MTTLIWDASALLHASLIDGLESLGDLASGPANDQWRNHTTAAVAQEVNERGGRIPEWLKVVHVDAIEELLVLAAWVSRVSSATHSRGEATVLAWAECHGAIAIVDDADARRVALSYGIEVHGVLWVGVQAVVQGRWNAGSVRRFFDRMLMSGARYPFEIGGFEDWARARQLLD